MALLLIMFCAVLLQLHLQVTAFYDGILLVGHNRSLSYSFINDRVLNEFDNKDAFDIDAMVNIFDDVYLTFSGPNYYVNGVTASGKKYENVKGCVHADFGINSTVFAAETLDDRSLAQNSTVPKSLTLLFANGRSEPRFAQFTTDAQHFEMTGKLIANKTREDKITNLSVFGLGTKLPDELNYDNCVKKEKGNGGCSLAREGNTDKLHLFIGEYYFFCNIKNCQWSEQIPIRDYFRLSETSPFYNGNIQAAAHKPEPFCTSVVV